MLLALISGCASDHDLQRDGQNVFGGGFIDEEHGVGLYLVRAFSNISPFSTPNSAFQTFTKRAETLCQGKGYKIVNSNLGTYDTSIPMTPPPKVTFMAGNILCSDSTLTFDEAKKLLLLE